MAVKCPKGRCGPRTLVRNGEQEEAAAMMEDMRTGGRFEMKEIIIAGQKYTEEDAKEILKLAKEFTKRDDSPEAKHLVENIEQNIKMHFGDKK